MEEFPNSDLNIILCRKCLKNGEYLIPLFHLNELNEIEYKCSKNHIIEKNDIIIEKLNEKLIILLSQCTDEEHINNYQDQDKIFCAWCDKCGKNICQIDVGKDLKRNHDYILYMKIIPDLQYEIIIKEKLNKLKGLIDRYNIICPDAKDEIKYLNNTYNRNYMNYNLYYNKKIINYQTINNILFNSNDDFNEKSFEEFESILKIKRYKFFYKELLNINSLTEINKKEFETVLPPDGKIIPFIKKNTDINNKYFGVYGLSFGKITIIDDTGKKINELLLKPSDPYFNDFLVLFQDDILISYNLSDFSIYYFSEDYSSYELHTIGVGSKKFHFDYFGRYNNFHLNKKFIKTSSNNYILIMEGEAFLIDLNKYIINFFFSKNSKENLKLLNFNNNVILNANSALYKENNNIYEGLIVTYIIKNKNTSFGIELLNENLKKILEIEFNTKYINKNNNTNYILEINYNYLNETILVFINSKIHQLSSVTKEIVTIYDISPSILDINFFFYDSKEIIFFYHYNEKNKKLEQIIIIINKKNNKIYQYIWDEKLLILKKEYTFLNIKNVLPLFTHDIFDNLNNNNRKDSNLGKKYIEEILVIDSDNFIILN